MSEGLMGRNFSRTNTSPSCSSVGLSFCIICRLAEGSWSLYFVIAAAVCVFTTHDSLTGTQAVRRRESKRCMHSNSVKQRDCEVHGIREPAHDLMTFMCAQNQAYYILEQDKLLGTARSLIGQRSAKSSSKAQHSNYRFKTLTRYQDIYATHVDVHIRS